MPVRHTIYPFGLAAANIAAGWLLYGVLNVTLGAVLAPIGVIIILAMVHDAFRPATRHSSTLSRYTSRKSTTQSPPEHGR